MSGSTHITILSYSKRTLGLTYLQLPIEFKGIMQCNFRLIDEDVLGKAYESLFG